MKNNDLIDILEDSFKNGVVAKGYLEVVRSVQQKKAKLVIIANDVDNEKMILEIKRLCNIYETPLITQLTKMSLGKVVGLEIPTGFLSIKISGFDKDNFEKYLKFVAKAKNQ
jgi:ribosomal protein L7Ae-like RNA K-turn-binding protein